MNMPPSNVSQHNFNNNRINAHRSSLIFLTVGVLCYGLAVAQFLLESRIRSSVFIKSIAVSVKNLVNNGFPVIAVVSLVGSVAFMAWILCRFKKVSVLSSEPKQSFSLFRSVLQPAILSLFLIYSLFPLQWMQLAPARSLESYPEGTVLDFLLLMLVLIGTIFFCLYLFYCFPQRISIGLDRGITRLCRLNERYAVAAVVFFSLFITGIFAYFVLGHIPHVQDSIAQLFHAKIFQSGSLFASLPPHKEFFDYINVLNFDKWYSQYPPGHIVMLTLGLITGLPWLVGPVLGALSLLVFFVLTKNIYRDRRTALICCFMMFLSPFFLFMSSSHMNHTTTLLFTLLFLYFYIQIYLSGKTVFALGAGLSLGYVLNVRPLTAGALGIIFVFYLLYSCFYKKEIKLKNILVFSAALAVMVGLLLLFNQLTNGDPLVFGYQKKYQALGFLGKAQFGTAHTIKGGIVNTSNNLIGLNQYLFEWPIPSLVFAVIFFAVPIKKNRWDWLFLSAFLSVVGSYFCYYYQDLCFGPRFYYSIMPFAIIFSVRGFMGLPGWLEQKGFDRRKVRATLALLLIFCVAYTFLFSFPRLINKYSDDYWIATDKIHTEIQRRRIKNALVFIDVWHPRGTLTPNLIPYGSGFQFNSPDLSDEVIYAIDLREKNAELMRYYAGRDFYLCKIFSSMADFELKQIKGPVE